MSRIPGLKRWTISGPVGDTDSVPSSGSSDSGVQIPRETMKPNPDSTIRRSLKRRNKVARITIDPEVRGGVPCVRGGQWPITHILEKLAAGIAPQSLVQEYPDLTLADIQLALDVAAWVMRDPAIDWSALNLPEMVDFQHEMQAWQSLSDDALGLIDNPSRD